MTFLRPLCHITRLIRLMSSWHSPRQLSFSRSQAFCTYDIYKLWHAFLLFIFFFQQNFTFYPYVEPTGALEGEQDSLLVEQTSWATVLIVALVSVVHVTDWYNLAQWFWKHVAYTPWGVWRCFGRVQDSFQAWWHFYGNHVFRLNNPLINYVTLLTVH